MEATAAATRELDNQLVEETLRGSREAFGTLVEQHFDHAFAVAYRILAQKEDAEDAVQDGFIKALEKLSSFDLSRPLKPWLLRIVANRAYDLREARSVRTTQALDEGLVGHAAGPEQELENAELGERLRAALRQLPEQQRVIVELFEIEGMNSAEISEGLGIPRGTVRWTLHQARKVLREAMETMKNDC